MPARPPSPSARPASRVAWECSPKAGGMLHPRLNTDTRPIADKYREGKLKRTLKRGLKVRETAQREADGATKSDQVIQRSVGIMRGQP